MKPKRGSFYRHFKGEIYQVLGFAKCTETMKEKVLYKSFKDRIVWSRDIEEFMDIHPVAKVQRFVLIESGGSN